MTFYGHSVIIFDELYYMERREKMLKKVISAISALCVVVSCTVSGYAFQYVDTKTGEIDKPVSDTVGALLEGIFTGDTIEVEDPDRREVGFEDKNGNGLVDDAGDVKMHFPDFVTVDGVTYAYYIKWDDNNGAYGINDEGKPIERSCIGLATTTDGINFDHKGLVIAAEADTGYDGYMASFPGVWYEDGIWYVAYECNQAGDNGDVALATSTDGIHFDKKGIIIDHKKGGAWTSYNVGTPDIYKEGDMWYVTFHGFGNVNGKRDVQIGVAYGTDLMNLTIHDGPVIETSDNKEDHDSGTCGRRDIIKYKDYYYMCYEVSTDSTTVYYDFQHASWGHMFARSKDMIHWEKAPNALHEFTEWDYAYDGPAWLPLGDKLYLYYRTFNVTTAAVEFKLTRKIVTDEASGISAKIGVDQALKVEPITSGGKYILAKRNIEKGYDAKVLDISILEGDKEVALEEPLTFSMKLDPDSVFDGTVKVNHLKITTLEEIPSTFKDGVLTFDDQLRKEVILTYEPKLYGDVNRDLTVDISDALVTLQKSVGLVEFDEKQTILGDVDGSEGVTVSDALVVLQYAVGIVDKLPKVNLK